MIRQPAPFGLISGTSGGRVTGSMLSLLVPPYGRSVGHAALSPSIWKVTYWRMPGESVGYCSTGTANIRHKSVSALQLPRWRCVSAMWLPEFLAYTPISQKEICYMRPTDCLPVRAHMLVQLCVNKDLLVLLIMLQNQPGALSKWLVEDG